MPKHEIKHPDKLVRTAAYSNGVVVDGWLCVSGQGPLDLKTGTVIKGSIEDQTRLTLRHLGKILEAAGGTFDSVVKCTCHLSDMQEFDRFNLVYGEFFRAVRPSRTSIHALG